MDIPAFRQAFPAFVDPATWPEFQIQFWAGLAEISLPEDRWGDFLNHGVMLFVAHHLVVEKPNELVADGGGVPGEIRGPVTSKSVDGVSVSRDIKAVTSEDAGFWNLSVYGRQFWRLAMMAGAGPLQI